MAKYLLICLVLIQFACKKSEQELPLEATVAEDLSSYVEIASIGLGGLGAAEIATFCPTTNKLFSVNNGALNKIDVIDLSNPAAPKVIASISMQPYGGFVNSLDVNGGKLAAAIEATNKQAPGKVVIFDTKTLRPLKTIVVGALPDHIIYSKNGKFIITANEGEPNDSYIDDPNGSISIINVDNGYTVSTINFSGFASKVGELSAKVFRVFGPGLNISKDL